MKLMVLIKGKAQSLDVYSESNENNTLIMSKCSAGNLHGTRLYDYLLDYVWYQLPAK